MVAGYRKSVDKFPFLIGSDSLCDVVLADLPPIAAQIANTPALGTFLEVFVDDAKLDGKAVDSNFAVKLSSAASLALANYQFTYFSS